MCVCACEVERKEKLYESAAQGLDGADKKVSFFTINTRMNKTEKSANKKKGMIGNKNNGLPKKKKMRKIVERRI